MSVFTNSCWARSLGFKSQGRKIAFASVTNGVASLRLGIWKALCNRAERTHRRGLVWARWGSPGLLASSLFRARMPLQISDVFLSMFITRG